MDYNFTRMAKKLSIVTVSGNVVLAAFKLFAGIFAHSGAMISDAVHSMSDDHHYSCSIYWNEAFGERMRMKTILTDMRGLSVLRRLFSEVY